MIFVLFFFFFKQKTAYEMRISDWSSDVCSSDLERIHSIDQGGFTQLKAGWSRLRKQKAKVRAGAKICLAGSGGGHVRQLLDLEPAWRGHDAFFITEDTALGESLAEHYRCLFVPHVAMGQARLGAPFRIDRKSNG